MKLGSLALAGALGLMPLCGCFSAASAADLMVSPAPRAGYVAMPRPAYVYWDDVYPPAIYGAQLRPVEEVAAMKAERHPVPSGWSYGWYGR